MQRRVLDLATEAVRGGGEFGLTRTSGSGAKFTSAPHCSNNEFYAGHNDSTTRRLITDLETVLDSFYVVERGCRVQPAADHPS